MLLLESSTNTGSEVFTEPCGLNKLLWKEEDDEKRRGGGEKWNGVSVSCSWERARVGSAAPFSFFYFNQKQRRSAVEKAWRKAKFTWAKGRGGGGGVRGGGRVDTNKQTTTDEQLRRALQWQRGRGRKRRNDGRESAPQLQKWKVHISAQYGNMVLISWFNSRSLPFPPSLTTPFPTKLSCFLLQLQFGYKRLLKHRKASKTDKKIAGGRSFGRARGWSKWERKRNAGGDVVWTMRSYWTAESPWLTSISGLSS